MKNRIKIFLYILCLCICTIYQPSIQVYAKGSIQLDSIPEYEDSPYVKINKNKPYFSEDDLKKESFESYSNLDSLGRCQQAYALIGQETMPTEKRGSIGSVKPSGWHTVRYDDVIEDKYLYNRCHLIAYELAGENANEKNLITGTRYLNVQGMLPFENKVAQYVKETGNHVLYRVTPIYEGDNLLCNGVEIEAMSQEDGGYDICFNVYCYNVQPGIDIDYATGDSSLSDDTVTEDASVEETYIINTNTKKFHKPDCSSVNDMAKHNKKETTATTEELIAQGYSPCQRCLKSVSTTN